MNNESKIQEVSNENYKGYQIRVSDLGGQSRSRYYINIISDRLIALKQKYPSRFRHSIGKYCFAHNLEQAEAHVATIKANIDSKANAKQQRLGENAKAREEFVNPYKVGDILYSSWGYDQTNREFYQIVAVGNRSLKLRQIGAVSVRDTSWCSDECAPVKDKFVTDEINRVNIVVSSYNGKASHSVKSPIHGYLYKHEGGTHYRSWGH